MPEGCRGKATRLWKRANGNLLCGYRFQKIERGVDGVLANVPSPPVQYLYFPVGSDDGPVGVDGAVRGHRRYIVQGASGTVPPSAVTTV